MEWLEKLRAKPEAYRRRILAFSTTLITAAIVVIWLVTLGAFPEAAGGSRKAGVDGEKTPIFQGFIREARAIIDSAW